MCSMNQKQKKSTLIYSQKTLEVEGLKQTEVLIKFSLKYLSGKISSKEAIINIRNQILTNKAKLNCSHK